MSAERNDRPGLRAGRNLDVTRCRQIVGHWVETTAVHSKTRGWLPMVKLDISHIPLAGDPTDCQTLELLIAPGDLADLRVVLATAEERAELDAAIGVLNEEDA